MPRLAIVDASVAVKWLFKEPGTAEAIALRSEWKTTDMLPCAPQFLLVELHNVICKKIRADVLKPDDPLISLSPTFGLDLNWAPTVSLLPEALNWAIRLKMPIYDALYAALAHALGGALYTCDRVLADRLHGTSITVHPL